MHRKRGRPRKNPEPESQPEVSSKSKKGASISRNKVKTEVKVETKSTTRGRKPSLKVKDEYKEVNKKSTKGPRTKLNFTKKEEYESDARSGRSKSKATKAVKVEARPRGRPPKDKNLLKKAASRPTKGSVTKKRAAPVKVKAEPKPRRVKKEVVRKPPARKPAPRRVKVEVEEFSSDDESEEFEGESESEEEEEESPERILRTPKEVGRRKKESNIRKRSPVRPVKEEPKRTSRRLGCKQEEGLSKIQQKVINKGRMKREELPVFPTKSMYVEDLILDAIKYLKSKASEDNVLEYLEKRFVDINQDLVAGVMDRLIFEERISLKRGGRRTDKRPLHNFPDFDYLRSSPKRKKTEREPVIRVKKEVIPKKRRQPPPIKKEETIYETDPEVDDEKYAKIEEDSSESDIQFIEVIEIFDVDVKNEEERYEKPQPAPQKSVVFRDEPRMVPPKRKEEKKIHHHHHHNNWTSRPYHQNQSQSQSQQQVVKNIPRKDFREDEKINTIVNNMNTEETVAKVEGNRTPERARGEQIEEESEKDEKETQEATVKVSESNSKKALIEYYEKKLLGNSNYKNNLESQKKKDIAGKSERETAQTNEEITKKEEPEAAGATKPQQPQRVVSDFVAEALTGDGGNNKGNQVPVNNNNKKPEETKKAAERDEEQKNEAKVEEDGRRAVACDQTIQDHEESQHFHSHSHSHSEHEGGERKEGRLQEIMRMLSETGPINQTNEEEIVQKVEEGQGQGPVVDQGIETENLVLNSQNINSQAFGTQMSQSSLQICYSQSLLTESAPLVMPDSQVTGQGEPKDDIVKLSTSQMLREVEVEAEKEPKISVSQMEEQAESANKKQTVLSNSPILKGITHEPTSEAKVNESQLNIKISASQIIEIEDDDENETKHVNVPHPQNIILQQNNEEDLTTPAPTYTVFTRLVPMANTNDEEEAAFRRDPAEELVSPKFGGGSIQKNDNENQADREGELDVLKKDLSKVIVQKGQDKENQKPTEGGEDVVTKTEEGKCKEEEEPSKENVQKVKEKIRTAVGEYFNLIDGKAVSDQRTEEGSQKDPLVILDKEKNSVDENYVKEEEGSGKFSVSKYFN